MMQGDEQPTTEGLARDAATFGELFRRLRGRLEMWIGVRMGPLLRSRLTVEDVMQETLLEAHRSLPSFSDRGPGSFRRWVFAVAENRLRDLHKFHAAKKRHPERETGPEATSPAETALIERLAADQSTPSSVVRRKEAAERLRAAISRLPEDLREVLVQRAIEERGFEEIAERVGRPASTVKGLYARALRILKDELGS